MFILKIIVTLIAGIIAGFINSMAGGGSLLTLPALSFLGLPMFTANATNRISILAGNVIASINFKRRGYSENKTALMLSLPAIAGGIIGSRFSINLPESLFNIILSTIMVFIFLITMRKPKILEEEEKKKLTIPGKALLAVSFFLIGIYGGLIQVGVGFIIIATLNLLTNFSMAKINGVKVVIISAYTIFVILVFSREGKIDWLMGMPLATGSLIGGFLGSNFAVSVKEKWIKLVMGAAVIAMIVKISGIWKPVIQELNKIF